MSDQPTAGQKLDATLAHLATKDDLATMERRIVRGVVAEINGHTDTVVNKLVDELRNQGLKVSSVGKKAG